MEDLKLPSKIEGNEWEWQGCVICSKHIGYTQKDVYPTIVCSEECAKEWDDFQKKESS